MGGEFWTKIRFGDCANLVRNTVSPLTAELCPYVGLEHIGENTLALTGQGKSHDVTTAKTKFAKNDILFGKLRPYFRKVVRAPFDGICSTDIWVVRSRYEVDQGFLYYRMASQVFVDFANAGSTGTKMPRANWDHVESFEFSLPPLPEQRAIAHILGTLDDKIELNRRMNETLEAMARALFKSWFVDFDPVRAKMAGRDTGLPPHIADLFPDRLVPSELGEIPEGWTSSTLGEHVVLFDSKRIPLSRAEREKRRGIYPYHGAAGVMDHIDDYLFDGVHFLVGEDGSVTNKKGLAVTQYVWGKFWVNNHAHVLQGKAPVSTEHAYLHFHFEPVAPYVTGAVQPKLSQGRMKSIPFLFPNTEICNEFAKMISPWFEQIRTRSMEDKTLATLRETLLTKLISGELRVCDAEAFLERNG